MTNSQTKAIAPTLLICPGIHDPALTQSFVGGLELETLQPLRVAIFPVMGISAVCAPQILHFLKEQVGEPGSSSSPIIVISYSAGVVGAIGAAWGWQLMGGRIKALIALDGWGVPLGGNFPIHRLSHDRFTRDSSALLGMGEDSFYADPAVEHLDLWRSPQMASGWGKLRDCQYQQMTAAEFLRVLIARYLPG